MAYCTQADIEKLIPGQELAELTTESGDVADANVVAEAITRADAEIDTYLGIRYQVPFAAAPGRVKSLSVDMAIYHLYNRRSVMPELRQKNYENAISYLREVSAGKAVIMDGGQEITSAVRSRQVVEVESAERVFKRDTMTNW